MSAMSVRDISDLKWHPLHGWETPGSGSGELNWLAQQKYGRMFGALTPEERETLTSPGYDRLLTDEEEKFMAPSRKPDEWTADRIFSPKTKSDADFVIRACNAHGDLVEALQRLLDSVIEDARTDPDFYMHEPIEQARAALANVRGEGV